MVLRSGPRRWLRSVPRTGSRSGLQKALERALKGTEEVPEAWLRRGPEGSRRLGAEELRRAPEGQALAALGIDFVRGGRTSLSGFGGDRLQARGLERLTSFGTC
ncbi:hypothetical protein GUJ93_ZPchr0006g44920 [Zizania palustris]|uniref:Uncharacterized protein n=1 Tax=Zizania palustris TaxID=103762 RepID=A0A8J5SIK9_ZIZPA|nr:hypothetical protein GUJ93_ZPchr0006g44920 [Zizania palustris]